MCVGRSVLHGPDGWLDGGEGEYFWWDMEISASAVLFNLHNYFYFPMSLWRLWVGNKC